MRSKRPPPPPLTRPGTEQCTGLGTQAPTHGVSPGREGMHVEVEGGREGEENELQQGRVGWWVQCACGVEPVCIGSLPM